MAALKKLYEDIEEAKVKISDAHRLVDTVDIINMSADGMKHILKKLLSDSWLAVNNVEKELYKCGADNALQGDTNAETPTGLTGRVFPPF